MLDEVKDLAKAKRLLIIKIIIKSCLALIIVWISSIGFVASANNFYLLSFETYHMNTHGHFENKDLTTKCPNNLVEKSTLFD